MGIKSVRGDEMRNHTQIVDEVKGTMAIEGMHLKNQDIYRLQQCAQGKVSSKELVKKLVLQYKGK